MLYFSKNIKIGEFTIRRTLQTDEKMFIELLHSVYGNTYSYKSLYEVGGYSSIILNQNIICFGIFDDTKMIGHTGLIFKDNKNDYVESGYSMRLPNLRNFTKSNEVTAWNLIMELLANHCVYVHQNTTTYHPFAQIYATKILNAKPTGIILNYAIGEEITGYPSKYMPMQAITHSSLIKVVDENKKTQVPTCAWENWISNIFMQFGREVFKAEERQNNMSSINIIEDNPHISLKRIKCTSFGEEICRQLEGVRTILVHVPCDGSDISDLIQNEFIPVGIRPHFSRQDEIILQYIPIKNRLLFVENLKQASIAANFTKKMILDWIEITLNNL